jgi:F0F1-type ATP synthase membrane subunit b/b'
MHESSVVVNMTEQHDQFDVMYNAVAALVSKQAKSSGSNATNGKQPSPISSPLRMVQQRANPFAALDDVFEKAKDKANEVVDQAKEKANEVVDQAKDKANEVVDQAKEKAADLADNLNKSSIMDGLGDIVAGKGADMLKKIGDMKDQFAEKLNSTLGKAMDQFGDLQDKLEDAKDAQILKVAKSLASAGNMTLGMAQSALEKVQDKMTELEDLKGELDKISTDEELAAAKEKLDDKLDGMSGLLSLLNSVAHTNIDVADMKSGEDKVSEDVQAKVDGAKAELQKALDKAKSAERAGQVIVDTLDATLAKINDSVAKLEAKAAANDERDGQSKQDNTDKAASDGNVTTDSDMSIIKSLFSEMNTVRQVIQGTYNPDEEAGPAADTTRSDDGDAKSSDNGEKADDADDSAADINVDDTKAEKSGAGAAVCISTIFVGIAICNAL